MEYKKYCEELFNSWKNDEEVFNSFKENFDYKLLPEPYYSIKASENGKGTLYFLNYNPGGEMSFQHHDEVSAITYKEQSENCAKEYCKKTNNAADSRISRMKEVTSFLGYNQFENLETFFLHSKNFKNKDIFLAKYSENEYFQKYKTYLQNYLKDKPVIAVCCVGKNVTKEYLQKRKWLKLMTEIIGLDIEKAKIISEKSGNSAVVQYENKVMTCYYKSRANIIFPGVENIINL